MNFKDYIKITSRHLESLENKEVFNENLKKEIIKSEGIYIVGIGSSYYASLMAKQYFEYLNVEIKVIKSEDFNKQENLKKN